MNRLSRTCRLALAATVLTTCGLVCRPDLPGDQAQVPRDAFALLTDADKATLLELLLSLRTPRRVATDLAG